MNVSDPPIRRNSRHMIDSRCDYTALAAADRALAEASGLENVRDKHLKSAECWDRLALAELELRPLSLGSPGEPE